MIELTRRPEIIALGATTTGVAVEGIDSVVPELGLSFNVVIESSAGIGSGSAVAWTSAATLWAFALLFPDRCMSTITRPRHFPEPSQVDAFSFFFVISSLEVLVSVDRVDDGLGGSCGLC